MRRIILVSLAALLLSGCGSGILSPKSDVIQYEGNDLHCLYYSHSVDCDWVRYHQENP